MKNNFRSEVGITQSFTQKHAECFCLFRLPVQIQPRVPKLIWKAILFDIHSHRKPINNLDCAKFDNFMSSLPVCGDWSRCPTSQLRSRLAFVLAVILPRILLIIMLFFLKKVHTVYYVGLPI